MGLNAVVKEEKNITKLTKTILLSKIEAFYCLIPTVGTSGSVNPHLPQSSLLGRAEPRLYIILLCHPIQRLLPIYPGCLSRGSLSEIPHIRKLKISMVLRDLPFLLQDNSSGASFIFDRS